MLDQLEKLAVFLRGFRWWLFALWVGVSSALAIQQFRGYEVVWPFTLSFMWLFDVAFFIGFFQRSKRLEEARRFKDAEPRFMYQLLTSTSYWYISAWCFLLSFGFLALVTVRVLMS
jgi:hypothetical protein